MKALYGASCTHTHLTYFKFELNNKKEERKTLVKLPIRDFSGWILYRAAMPISEKKKEQNQIKLWIRTIQETN